MEYSISQVSENVHKIHLTCESTDTLHTLMVSDVHFDSMKCQRKLLKSHLDEIKERDGLVFVYGDWFDVMATYGDKRQKREEVDPRYIVKGRSYLDLVIEDSIEFLSPYAENIALISYGNHETTIHKYHDTDPIRRLVTSLNARNDTDIQMGAYSGWVQMRFRYKSGGCGRSHTLHYHHGFGGNAKRSKGMLDVQIEAMKYPDADMLVRGHDHQKWYDPSTTRMRIRDDGKVYKDNLYYVKTGSYKDGIGDGKMGWEVEKNFMPTRMGGWFVDYAYHKRSPLKVRVTEAH